MADGYPPVPPQVPSEGGRPAAEAPRVPAASGQQAPPVAWVPPAGPPAAGYAPYPPAEPPKRRRGLWWAIGIVVVLLLVIASCTVPFMLLSGDSEFPAVEGNAIAVIHLDGVIAGTGDYYSGYLTPEYFLDQLDQAESDDFVKAIVLRVDSPGGTVAASEEIAAYVSECSKPVVVSVGDIALLSCNSSWM